MTAEELVDLQDALAGGDAGGDRATRIAEAQDTLDAVKALGDTEEILGPVHGVWNFNYCLASGDPFVEAFDLKK